MGGLMWKDQAGGLRCWTHGFRGSIFSCWNCNAASRGALCSAFSLAAGTRADHAGGVEACVGRALTPASATGPLVDLSGTVGWELKVPKKGLGLAPNHLPLLCSPASHRRTKLVHNGRQASQKSQLPGMWTARAEIRPYP
jgi:hypothetical protein